MIYKSRRHSFFFVEIVAFSFFYSTRSSFTSHILNDFFYTLHNKGSQAMVDGSTIAMHSKPSKSCKVHWILCGGCRAWAAATVSVRIHA